MNRLNWIIAIACACAITACGGGGAPADTAAGKLVTTTEQAVLGGTTPVDERIAKALDGLSLPPAVELPGLPGAGLPEKLPSVVQTSSRNGAEYYATLKSDNAIVEGTTLRLAAEADALSWAIYQFPIGSSTSLNKLTITASNGSFAGANPGYWVGLADYTAGIWRPIALMPSTDSPYIRTFDISSSSYLSPSNNLYVFVLTQDGQSATMDSLSLDFEASTWQHVEFGEGANNAGWTLALAFVKGAGSLMIVYADFDSRKARYGVWDMAESFELPASWAFMDVDGFNPLDTDIAGSTCKWLDLAQDPVTGFPVVSLIYDGVTGGSANSIIGLSVYKTGATALFFNYRLGNATGKYVDGGGYTSVDRNPVTGEFVVAHYVANTNWTPAHDINLRVFTPETAAVRTTKNFATLFGIPCYFPHVRCLPDQNYAFSVNGGHMYELMGSTYLDYNLDDDSNAFGSVCDSGQAKGWGYTYVKQAAGASTLRFVEDLDNPSAPVFDVDTAAVGGWIGASQLAYNPAGNPGIAYTKYTGSGVEVKLAEYDGTAWTIETISIVPCTPADTTDREAVLVDLDYNVLGVPALIWNQVNGASSKAHVAMRSE